MSSFMNGEEGKCYLCSLCLGLLLLYLEMCVKATTIILQYNVDILQLLLHCVLLADLL